MANEAEAAISKLCADANAAMGSVKLDTAEDVIAVAFVLVTQNAQLAVALARACVVSLDQAGFSVVKRCDSD